MKINGAMVVFPSNAWQVDTLSHKGLRQGKGWEGFGETLGRWHAKDSGPSSTPHLVPPSGGGPLIFSGLLASISTNEACPLPFGRFRMLRQFRTANWQPGSVEQSPQHQFLLFLPPLIAPVHLITCSQMCTKCSFIHSYHSTFTRTLSPHPAGLIGT